ncbi:MULTISPECIES: dihydrofolate reductase [Priestia]|uniref:dihydrofolate reductase n=1 Tax=Priestia TaxID=2800373 RepID=UPI000C9C54C3|nr:MULTISPECIES: dihydrofolate reductase [Priestia]PNE08454.1 dihydrofolate reductase [Priestia megaterium]
MISFIFAMDKNRLIGKGNSLPWHLPADLKFFKQVTTGHPVVMGRKTHESIGKPLPGRENIILTRNISYDAKGCTVLNSISAIEEMGKKEKKEIFIIGGAEIYKLAFPIADRLYITTIDEEFEGDTYFPEFNESEWRLVSREKGLKDEKNPYDYYFTIYERNE